MADAVVTRIRITLRTVFVLYGQMRRKPFLGQQRGRCWDILAFVLLAVENETLRCVL